MPVRIEDTKPETYDVAKLLVPPTHQGPVDWFVFIDLIASAIKTLATGCAPTPVEAVRHLNWKPIFDPFGGRLARHRREMRAVLARSWKGPITDREEVVNRAMEAVEQGRVTVSMMRGLYAENVRGR